MKMENLINYKSLCTRVRSKFLGCTTSLLSKSTFKFKIMCNPLEHGYIV